MNVSSHLDFPKEPGAKTAAEALKAEGFEVETRPSADGVEPIALVSALLDDKDFDATPRKMQSRARSLGGRFDGYEEDA